MPALHRKYSDNFYLSFDMFEGDRDVDIRCRSVNLVKVKKNHECFGGKCAGKQPHIISNGETARVERAIVEGKWASYYMCIQCMDEWFLEIGVEPENKGNINAA